MRRRQRERADADHHDPWPGVNDVAYDRRELVEHYRRMLLIRAFEERVDALFAQGELKGTSHLSCGQEASAMGAVAALRPDDLVTSNHRGHGHFIAKGGDPMRIMAELFGKEPGYSQGWGGTQHMACFEIGFLGSNGITGGGVPIATGAALAARLRQTGQVVLAFFGDGGINQGTVHEALNMGAVWSLPVVYLCENNLYAMSTPIRETCRLEDLGDRAGTYGMPGVVVDGNDYFAVREAAEQAAERARNAGGPTLIEAKTYRFLGHSRGDLRVYRSKEEEEGWRARDPLPRMRDRLIADGHLTEGDDQRLGQEAADVVETSVETARRAPVLPVSAIAERATAAAEDAVPKTAAAPPAAVGASRAIYPSEAIREALSEEMERDPSVVLIGEDIGVYGGAFGVTRGMLDHFGADRVIQTPISENGFVGVAIGAALNGLRPVVEIMFMDFIALAVDQICNHAAKFRAVYGEQAKVPIVIRAAAGGGRAYGPTHSQSLEAWFAHTPGLKVVYPGTAADAKGLLKSAIRDDDPVIFIEPKALYNQRMPVPPGEYTVPLGVANVLQQGDQVSVISYGRMAPAAAAAGARLAKEGISAEVIDLRTLVPMDVETVAESVRKTGRALVVHEAHRTGGFGAEIVCQVLEHAFDYLDAPVRRLAAPDVPIPFSPELEAAAFPSVETIAAAARALVGR
jgi:2-oxoisovalerate dehydrogenase E1 component